MIISNKVSLTQSKRHFSLFSTVDEFVMRDTVAIGEFFSRLDDEVAMRIKTLIEVECHFVEDGCCQCIIGRTGTVGIETHHREDKPGGHRAAIVVAWDTVRLVGIVLSDQFTHDFLRAPFFTLEIGEEIGVGDVGLVGRVVESFIEETL